MTTETQTDERERLAYNAREAARLMGMPLRSLYRALESDEIHGVKISGRWYVSARTLERLLDLPARPDAV